MSDQRALFAAICAHPEEDTPRLAYADWLDESAGSMPAQKRESVRMRAELIRVQCELARMPPDDETPDTATRRVELEDREAKLTESYPRRASWAKPPGRKLPVGSAPPVSPDCNTFVRGFPLFASGSYEHLLEQGESLFDVSPLHHLYCWVNNDDDFCDRFFAQPWLSRVRRLRTRARDERLFSTSALANVEDLTLHAWELGRPGSPVVPPTLASLRVFEFEYWRPGRPQTFERLGELLHANVRPHELHFSRYDSSTEELRAALALPQFQSVEQFTFGKRTGNSLNFHNGLSADNVRVLVGAPCWRTLRAFRTRNCVLDRAGFELLASAPAPPNLRTLDLITTDPGNAVTALAGNPLLASITALELHHSPFSEHSPPGDAGVMTLTKSPYTTQLVRLGLANCRVGPKGVKAIAEAPFAGNLVQLDLRGCPIQKGGIDALVAPGNFPRLKRLDAGGAAKTRAHKQRLRERFGDAVRF